MAHRGVIGDDRRGPVAEGVDAGAVHRSLSWFKSRPGLQPSLLRSFGSASHLRPRLPRHNANSASEAARAAPKCRLMGPLRPFRGCGIWSKDHPRARATWRFGSRDAQHARPFFVPDSLSVRLDAQTNRHLHHPDHRRRSHRDRPGLRVRLFGHPGGQDAEGRGLPHRPGQFQSGHHHDRSGTGGCDLYRADHAGDRRQDHREGALRHSRRLCAAADHGRPDRAELRAEPAQAGHAGQIRHRDDRRHRRRHRQGRGSRPFPRGDDQNRPRDAALDPDQESARCAAGARRASACPRSSGRPSPWAAPAAASPTPRRNSSRSSSAASTPPPPTKS